ncbi:transposase [Thiothrix unzii]|uniref:Transposase n=1 Tax=Thiothrix unzii TaxID=111769 RepID=A0A975F631_9GAMM|nr:transposase [Thiothrix unzii]QTR52075.1 transposase [Thiothrix unzii]
MARYKPMHQGLKLLALDFDRQILPGTFEYALRHLVDNELDLEGFHQRYKNDVQGAAAFNPAALLKIILLAYSRGIISSRKIEAACRENMLFIAVSGDSQPHFTTLAAFIANAGELIAKLFAQVLLICDRQGLIGKELFAIDGVKLPSNASKEKSGTRADFLRQAGRMEKAAEKMNSKIDSDLGKRIIAQRFATVEPVFGNLRDNKRLHRFTLRGKTKVDGQWKLFCLMHNLEKLAHHGYAA